MRCQFLKSTNAHANRASKVKKKLFVAHLKHRNQTEKKCVKCFVARLYLLERSHKERLFVV